MTTTRGINYFRTKEAALGFAEAIEYLGYGSMISYSDHYGCWIVLSTFEGECHD